VNLNDANDARAASSVPDAQSGAQLFPLPLLIVRPLQLSQWIGNHLLKFMDNQLSFLLAMDCADG